VDDTILRYAIGWDKAIAIRILVGLAGAAVTLLAGRILLKRPRSPLAGVLWLLAGIVLVAFALAPQPIIRFVISTDYALRIRFILGAISVFVMLITFESIRVTRLQERYALLWVATGLVILGAAVFPQAVNLLRAVMGMQYVEAMVAVAFMFLVLLAFHFSSSVSSIQSKLEKTAQQNAILQARIEELEKKLAARAGADREQP